MSEWGTPWNVPVDTQQETAYFNFLGGNARELMADLEHASWVAVMLISGLVLLLVICPPLYGKYRAWKTKRAFRLRSELCRKRSAVHRKSGDDV